MSSAVSLIVPSYLAIQNDGNNNGDNTSKRGGHNCRELQIQIIAQRMTKLQKSLFSSTTSFSNLTVNINSSEQQTKIILYQRILHHTLLFFNSFLESQNDAMRDSKNEKKSINSYDCQQQQQIASSLLNFITILFQNDEILQKVIPATAKSHEMSRSQTIILHLFTMYCQAYYDALGKLPHSENLLQSSENIHSTLYNITLQLMKHACHSIPLPISSSVSMSSITTAPSMKYLAAILLGTDSQHCIQIDSESNTDVTNINASSTSIYSSPVLISSTKSSTMTTVSYSQTIFHECVEYFFFK